MASKKAIRNRVRAVAKKARIKRLNFQPVIKNVDLEEMKAGFGSKPAKKAAPKKEEATADKAEVKEKAAPKAEAKKEEGKAEKKEAAPKAEAKAAEDKKEDKQPAKEEKAS